MLPVWLAWGVSLLALVRGSPCGGRIVVGVDYYPEQWPLEDMRDDMTAIKKDLGADIIRIGEFMWHELEPEPGRFNFTLLDTVIGLANELKLEIMLGTPTATMPAWLHTQHPEVFTQGPSSAEGFAGASPAFGGRRQYSFNSPVYQRYVNRIVQQLAKKYAREKAITFWQVDNELGHEGSDLDFSPQALVAWRKWLSARYLNIDILNEDWGTVFWGVTYNNFDEVGLPKWTIPGGPVRPNENFRSTLSPGMLLDYRRFRRDSITAFSNATVKILRDERVGGCITTNAPGGFWGKAMDHNDVFAAMDMPAYDNYPVWGGSTAAPEASRVAIILDTVRGWSPGNQTGWIVAEQLIGAQGHDIIGYTPRPNQVRAWAAASLLHGATGLNFFRYRAAVFGQEEFCYGILDHTTPRGEGRKWNEAKDVYKLARDYTNLWLGPIQAQVALVYDMANIFAWQAQPQSVEFNWENEAHRLYRPFWRHGAAIDVISIKKLMKMGGAAEVAQHYKILILPAPMVTSDEMVDFMTQYSKAGGSLWIGYRADLKDPRSQMRRKASRLAALAGVEVAEIESLNPGVPEDIRKVTSTSKAGGVTATVDVWREGLRVSTSASASTKVLFNYSDDFFGAQGYAAVVRKSASAGGGEVIYVGAGIDPEALLTTAGESLKLKGVQYVGVPTEPQVERMLRRDRDGKLWRVEINHASAEAMDAAGKPLAPFEVRVAEPVTVPLFG